MLAARSGSGLALEFKRILANPRWFDASLWISILFYVCSHRGDIRQEQTKEKDKKKKKTKQNIIYTNFPTGL